MNLRELFLLSSIFTIMIVGTITNLFFSNTIGETCGLIHPFVFEAEVSIVQRNSGLTRSSDVSALPVNPNNPFEDSLDTYLRIYDGNRQLLAENDDFGFDLTSGIEEFFLREDMTIILEVGTYADSYEGRYELVIETTELPPVTPITIGDAVSGQINERETVRYSLEMTAADVVNIGVNGSNSDGDTLDTVLRVFADDGTLLAENDDFESLASRIEGFGVDEAQAVVIEIGTYEGLDSGEFTLLIEAAERRDMNAAAIAIGRPIEGSINFDETLAYRVTADSGQVLRISVDGIDTDGNELDTVLRAYDARGVLLAENDDFNGYTSTIDSLPVRDDGEILIELTTFAGQYAGDFVLLVEEQAVSPALPVTAGETINSTIEVDERLRYSIALNAGEGLNVLVDGINTDGDQLDTVLRLYDSAGDLLTENDDTEDGFNSAIVNFVVPEDGEYLIELGTFADGSAGEFTLEVDVGSVEDSGEIITEDGTAVEWRVNPRGELDSVPVTVVNDIKPGERDRYTLTLNADQAVNIYLREAPPEPVSFWNLWSYLAANNFQLEAEFWPTCLEFYGYVSEGAFIINDSGFSRWVERSKIAEEVITLCDVNNYEELQQGSGNCLLQASVGLTQFGQLLLYVILPGLAIVLPIFTVFLLQEDADIWWFSGLLLVAIFVLTSALLYVHLGTVSGIEALSEFAYGMFGGTATGAAIAFITKVLENFSGRARGVRMERETARRDNETPILPGADD